MFQTSSTNGKFDIVFTGDPTLEKKAKQQGLKATSASRRKNDEWKSKVFGKRNTKEVPDIRKVKPTKASQLRVEKEKKEKLARKKQLQSNKQDEKNASDIKVGHDDLLNFDNEISKESTMPVVTTNNIQIAQVSETLDLKQNDIPEIKQLKQTKPQTNLGRRGTYSFNPSNEGYISKKELDKLFSNVFSDYSTNQVEPTSVPGLDLSPRSSDTTQGTSQLSLSSRGDEIRRKQATPIEEYNPWGRPGCGAPIKDINPGDIRSALRRSPKDCDDNITQLKNNPPSKDIRQTSNSDVNHLDGGISSQFVRGQGKSLQELEEIERRRQKELEHQLAIAEQVEEKRRLKQLERDQKWKEEQEVEAKFLREREMIKQRLDEEETKKQEDEEMRRKHQELLEEGIRKATEEARKAKEEARRSKFKDKNSDTVKVSYSRKLHHDNEAITPRDTDFFYQNVPDDFEDYKLQNILNADVRCNSSSEPAEVTSKRTDVASRIPKPTKKNPKSQENEILTEKIDSFLTQSKKGKSKKHSTTPSIRNKSIETLNASSETSKTIEPYSRKNKSKINRSKEIATPSRRNNFSENSNVSSKVGQSKKRNSQSQKSFTESSSSLLLDFDVDPNDFSSEEEQVIDVMKQSTDTNLIPFHRSKTECLIADEVKKSPAAERKMKSRVHSIEEDIQKKKVATPESPTQRQQQILDQLQALRVGLLQKQQEYLAYAQPSYR